MSQGTYSLPRTCARRRTAFVNIMSFSSYKKLISSLLIASFLLPSLFFAVPEKVDSAGAFGYTTVGVNLTEDIIKEFSADGVSWMITNALLGAMTASIVKWINSGFEGDPLFFSDPETFFLDVANEASGQLIKELGLAGLCDPFKLQIQIALSERKRDGFKCTFLDVVDNFESFYNNTKNGGWGGWFQFTQYPQNNPYGVYLLAVDAQMGRQSTAEGDKQQELFHGQGVLSIKRCTTYDQVYEFDPENYGETAKEMGTNEVSKDGIKGCLQTEVTSPGMAVTKELQAALGVPIDRLVQADEIDEMIASIFNALINQLILTGLRSLSGSPEDGSGAWYEEGLTEDKQALLTEIDAAIEEESTKAGVVVLSEEGNVTIDELNACYGGQIAIINNPLFNPPGSYPVPSLDTIRKRMDELTELKRKGNEIAESVSTDEALATLDFLVELRKKTEEAVNPTELADSWIQFNEFDSGRRGRDPAVYAKQKNDLKSVNEIMVGLTVELGRCNADLEQLSTYIGRLDPVECANCAAPEGESSEPAASE